MIAFRLALVTLLVLTLPGLPGCGPIGGSGRRGKPDPRINAATANGPHGGPALALPGDHGFVELVIERGARPESARFVAYALRPDLRTPLQPAPSAVRVTLAVPAGAPTLELVADPASASRFTSAPGRLDADEYQGTLTLTLDGATTDYPFALR